MSLYEVRGVTDKMENVLEGIKQEILQMYYYLHNNPEASWAEHNTTRYLQEILLREGANTSIFAEHTGVIGELGHGQPVVGLRAEIDAVWQQVTGTWQACHSCGHDAHMSIVLGTVMLLNRLNFQLPGRLKVIFQPAEEQGDGALKIIHRGVIDNLDYLFGVHLRPIQELPNGTAAPAILHGATRTIQGKIQGCEAHAARPHLGINPIEAGAALVQALAQIHTDPQIPASIKMTSFNAGDLKSNVIPASATFSLDIRSQSNLNMAQIVRKLENMLLGISKIYGAEIEHQTTADIVAAELNPGAVKVLNQAIVQVLGTKQTCPPVITPGGEDFHYYQLHKPRLRATMLGLGCNLTPGLHHPQMTFDTEVIFTGIKILTAAVIDIFNNQERDG